MKSLKLSSNAAVIGHYCFVHCRNLDNLIIPTGVTTILYQAFEACLGLVHLKLPDTLTAIDG